MSTNITYVAIIKDLVHGHTYTKTFEEYWDAAVYLDQRSSIMHSQGLGHEFEFELEEQEK